jgi:hypothetical protein
MDNYLRIPLIIWNTSNYMVRSKIWSQNKRKDLIRDVEKRQFYMTHFNSLVLKLLNNLVCTVNAKLYI